MKAYEYKNELRDWLANYQWFNPFAVTLTMKQRFKGIALDKYIAQNQIKNFLSRISTKIFGNNYKRRKQNLNRIATAETEGRLHYHLFIDLPNYKQNEAVNLVKQNWNPKLIDYAYKQHRVEAITTNDGWLKYITKFKNDNDELDISNTYLDPSNRHSIR